MDDGEITPDGQYLVVRDNTFTTKAIVYSTTDGSLITEVTGATNGGMTGPAQDGVVVNDERAAVIGNMLVILDLQNLGTAPLLASHDVGNSARDLEVTPDGSLLVVRGGATFGNLVGGQYIFELATGTQVAYHLSLIHI